MPIHNIKFDTEYNIDEMLHRFNNLDINLKKKYFYIKQYEEYLYNLEHVFTLIKLNFPQFLLMFNFFL